MTTPKVKNSTLKGDNYLDEIDESEDYVDNDDEFDEADESDEVQFTFEPGAVVEEEEFFIDWYLEALADLLYKQGYTKNPNWLNDELYPKIYKAIIHLVRSGQYKLYKDPRVAEFFAVDFILSDDLEIYVLEVNYNPQILSVTKERIKRNYKMVQDTVEIYHAYTKSRYLRVRRFVKKLLKHTSFLVSRKTMGRNRVLYINSARSYFKKAMRSKRFKKEFLKIMKEKLEPNIKISKDNLYEKIIDENLKGSRAYHNLIEEKCL